MNYLILKSIVDATLSGYVCRNCSARATDKDIHVLGTAGNALNLEITCPHCQTVGVVKAEVNMLPPGGPANREAHAFFENLKNSMGKGGDVDSIKDSDILAIRESLKKSASVKDLFN